MNTFQSQVKWGRYAAARASQSPAGQHEVKITGDEKSSPAKFFPLVLVLGALLVGFWLLAPGPDNTSMTNDVIPTANETPTAVVTSPVPDNTTTNSIGMEFMLILPGEFKMGDESATFSERGLPIHTVTIEKAYYMGKYEVTQKQWREVMGSNPSYFKGYELPVEKVSWKDVQEFVRRLNEMEDTDKYRLPSEAEWEYAARASTTTRYYFGDNESYMGDYAWYSGNSGHKTHPVGQKVPNSWGLYDMHGNVMEWVQDRWHSDYDGAPTDGSSWESGSSSSRVMRGGSYGHFINYYGNNRGGMDPRIRSFDTGFRLVLEIIEDNITYKVPFKVINGTFEEITTGKLEIGPTPYEIIGAINTSTVYGIRATSLNNPSILYFDIDEQTGAETLDFLIEPDLTISANNLTYSTSQWLKNEDSFVALLGKKYYVIDSGPSNWIITEKLVDEGEDDDYLMVTGETLSLPEGWAINVLEVDVEGGNGRFSLTKDDVEVVNKVVRQRDLNSAISGDFVYEANLGGTDLTEVINFTVFQTYSGYNLLVKLTNIDLISTDTLLLTNGDNSTLSGYKIMTKPFEITISNENIIPLSKDGIIDIFGGQFSIKVNKAGNSVELINVLKESGMYEITGIINAIGTTMYATPENCPSILYYDFEKGSGGESLFLPIYANLTIPPYELEYVTSSWIDPDTGLYYIAWHGKKYFIIGTGSGSWNITEVLVDDDETESYVFRVGNSLILNEGFNLTLLEADVDGLNASFSLSQNGIELKNQVVSESLNFVYDVDSGSTDNSEILNFTVESVFSGSNTSLVKINNIDLISLDVFELNSGLDLFNDYTITTNESHIVVRNVEEISLVQDGLTYLVDGLFTVHVNEFGNQAALVTLIQV